MLTESDTPTKLRRWAFNLLGAALACALTIAVCLVIVNLSIFALRSFGPAHFAPLKTVEVEGQKFTVIPAAPPVDPHILAAKTAVEKLVAELDYYPQGWHGDGYNLVYRDGTDIWIANEDYGLSIRPPGGGILEGDFAGKEEVYHATRRWTLRKLTPGE